MEIFLGKIIPLLYLSENSRVVSGSEDELLQLVKITRIIGSNIFVSWDNVKCILSLYQIVGSEQQLSWAFSTVAGTWSFFSGGLKNGIPKLKPLRIKIIAKTIAKTGISLFIFERKPPVTNLPTKDVASIIGVVPNPNKAMNAAPEIKSPVVIAPASAT